MRVFVSCQAVDAAPCSQLVRALREAGVEVEHSPRNPLHGLDPRWPDWYRSGLATAIAACEVFVIVVDYGWDSSTWMAIEAEEACSHPDRGPRCLYWNPDSFRVTAAGAVRYLVRELPRRLPEAIRFIVTEDSGTGAVNARPAGAGGDIQTEQVYVQLLNEGTPTWRPTMAERLTPGLYRLLATEGYDPEDEEWEFRPGSVVRCETQERSGPFGKKTWCLVATQEIPDSDSRGD